MRFLNYATIVLGVCLCFFGCKTFAQPIQSLASIEKNIDDLRRSGQYKAALIAADEALQQTSDSVELFVLNLSRLKVCIEIEDYRCFSDHLQAANKIIESQAIPSELQNHFINRLNIWFSVVDWYFENYDQLTDRASTIETLGYYQFDLEEFYVAHRFAAMGYHLSNKPFEARRSISRKIQGLLALHAFGDDRPQKDVVARGLSLIIRSAHILGDNLYTKRLMSSLDDFILSNLPRNTVLHVDYLVETSEVLAQSDTRAETLEAIDRLEEAYSLASGLEIADEKRQYKLAYIKVLQTAYALQIGETKAAEAYHAENPIKFLLDEANADQKIERPSEAFHAVASILIRNQKDEPIDPAWIKLFSKPTKLESGGSQDDRYYKILRLYALGIAKNSRDPAEGFAEISQSVQEVLTYMEDRTAGFSGLFPLPRFVDRFILADFAKVASGREDLMPLAFQSVQLLQRNSRHTTGDFLYAKSLLPDETERRLAHQWRSLNQGMQQVEIQSLEHLTNPQLSEALTKDYRFAHEELIDLLDMSRFGLENLSSPEPERNLIPSIDDVQSYLTTDEAFLLQASYLDHLISFCVRQSGAWLTTRKLQQEDYLDFKLLRLSLTATHPPDPELDKQFPLQASYRAYETVLADSAPCLADAKKVAFVPSELSAGVPIEVLTTEPSSTDDGGIGLNEQPWFLNQASVRYSGSVQEFLAGIKAARPIGNKFLGIGDPQLGGAYEVASTRSPAKLSAAVSELTSLPNTRDELINVARFFDGSELLLGSDATEQRFRDVTTTGVDVVSFATHGLIAGELTGLNEPALVLTPPSDDLGGIYAVNDGLLTGSEIAALNLDASLAILSACNTANYDTRVFSSGLRSLSNAFQVSGVQSVLASLWPVETYSSEYQVTQFTEFALAEGEALDDALRLAKSKLMNFGNGEFSHPRFWAPFVLLGNSARSSEQSDPGQQLKLYSLDVENDPGSEYLHVDESEDGAIATSKIGRWNGTRFSSIFEAARPGEDVVEFVSDIIGAGTIAITDRFLATAGYISEAANTMTAYIGVYDTSGEPLWDWSTYPVPGSFSQILDAKLFDEEDGSPLVATLIRRGCCKDRSLMEMLELYWLFDGEVLRQDVLDEKAADFSQSFGWIFQRQDDFLIIHSLRSPPATEFVGSSDLAGVADPCLGNFETRVISIRRDENSEIDQTISPGIRINSAIQKGDDIILAGGTFSRCENTSQAFVGEVKNGHRDIQTLWVDPQLVNSNAVYANEIDDHLVVVSDWVRKFSSSALVMGEKSVGFDPYQPRAENSYQFTETVVSRITEDGEIERAFLSSASSVHPFAARTEEGKLYVYGSYSNRAMVGEFRW